LIRVTITPKLIEVRGHASLAWCAAVSTVLQMLRKDERAIVWYESVSERRNHYVMARRRDELDGTAVRMLAELAISGTKHVSLIVKQDPDVRRRRRSKKKKR
jgi:hypothetical protein